MVATPCPGHAEPMQQQEWLVQLVVRASAEELDAITDRLAAAVCDPPDHRGACATPWTLVTLPVADLPKKEQSGWHALLNEDEEDAERWRL